MITNSNILKNIIKNKYENLDEFFEFREGVI